MTATTAAKADHVTPGAGIGGDFPLPVELLTTRSGADFREYFHLDQDHFLLYDSGRSAMKGLLSHLVSGRPGGVLLPSYLCPAVLQPVREAGLPYRFYQVDSQLQIDVGSLSDRVRERPAAVILIHYFGFPVSEAVWNALAGLSPTPVVIEDCAQALLTRVEDAWLGRRGDYSITSLRKWLPVPDGAWLVAKGELPPTPEVDCLSGFLAKRTLGMLLKRSYLSSPRRCSEDYSAFRTLLEQGEATLGRQRNPLGISALSRDLLGRIDYKDVLVRRRENYTRLLEELHEINGLEPIFRALPDGVCPLGFPVRLPSRETRDALRRWLTEAGVYPPIHWTLPDEVGRDEFRESWSLSERTLTIPIDQRYGREDMAYVASALHSFLERRTG